MRIWFIIVAPVLLIGCGPSASRITTPDAGKGFFVRCEDTKEGCFRKAISICRAGYKVLDSENISPTRDHAARFEMLIQCDSSWQNVNRAFQKKN